MKQPGTKKIVHRKSSFKKVAQKNSKEVETKVPSVKTGKLLDTSWGNVSSWYEEVVEDTDSYQAMVIAPHLSRLVGDVASKHVLDLACGEGYFTRLFKERGARTTGVDISKELIALAKTKDKTSDYIVAASHELNVLGDIQYNTVICVLALQNIENLRDTFVAVQRVLKKGGSFIFVLNHPSFRNPKQADWYFNTEKKVQGRVVYEYMTQSKIKIDMTPGTLNVRKKEFTVSFHRPLQSFIKELTKAGFLVSGMEEWVSHKESEKGPRQLIENKARHEIPMFLCISAVKI